MVITYMEQIFIAIQLNHVIFIVLVQMHHVNTTIHAEDALHLNVTCDTSKWQYNRNNL